MKETEKFNTENVNRCRINVSIIN